MKKMFIFLGAFWVSFMAIYSIYYYKIESKLDSSIVAEAENLPNTVMGLPGPADSAKNMIFSEGLDQVIPALGRDSNICIAPAPDTGFVSFNDVYTKNHIEKFYEGLVTKFTNHPPIGFKDLKDGQRLLLSYFFQNVRLPEGFRVSERTVEYKGSIVSALQYHPKQSSDTDDIAFYKNDLTHEYALKVKTDDGKGQLVMYSNPNCRNWQIAEAKANSLTDNTGYRFRLAKDQSVLVPEIDFNIVKYFGKEDVHNHPLLNGYKLIEEKTKFKISAPKRGGPIEASSSYNTAYNFIMNGNVLFYIKEAGKKCPYCIIYVKNPEILKKVKARN